MSNKIRNTLFILQLAVIAVLCGFLFRKNECTKVCSKHHSTRPHMKVNADNEPYPFQTNCQYAKGFAMNYKKYMKDTAKADSTMESAVIEIEIHNLLKVIASTQTNHILGVFGRKDKSNTLILFPVNANGQRVDIYGYLPNHVDEMFPSRYSLANVNYDHLFNCK